MVISTLMKILLYYFPYGIIEGCHCSFYGRLNIWICDSRNSILFTSIIKMHFAALLPGSFLHEVRIDMELSPVLLKPCSHLLNIGFSLCFEINNLNCVSLTSNKVNFTFDDIVRLDKRYIDLSLLYL